MFMCKVTSRFYNVILWILVIIHYLFITSLSATPADRSAVESKGVVEIIDSVSQKVFMKNDVPKKLIDTLSKREKQIYQKLYAENKNIKTTACELGIASSTVRTIKKTLTDKILEHIQKNI